MFCHDCKHAHRADGTCGVCPCETDTNTETPQEHIRNALAILNVAGTTLTDTHGYRFVLSGADYDAIRARLFAAVNLLEGK